MAIVLKVLVGLIGALLGLIGVQWMFNPVATADQLGITLDGVMALNTARGSAGGPFIGNVVLIALGLTTGDGRWLQASAVMIAGVMLGRIVGQASDGIASQALVSIGVEIVMVGVLLAAARSNRPLLR